jgi:hypothetical protein
MRREFIVSEVELTPEEIRELVPGAKTWTRFAGGYLVNCEDGKGAGNGKAK